MDGWMDGTDQPLFKQYLHNIFHSMQFVRSVDLAGRGVEFASRLKALCDWASSDVCEWTSGAAASLLQRHRRCRPYHTLKSSGSHKFIALPIYVRSSYYCGATAKVYGFSIVLCWCHPTKRRPPPPPPPPLHLSFAETESPIIAVPPSLYT